MKILLFLMLLATNNALAQECKNLDDNLIRCRIDKTVCVFKTITCFDEK